MKNLSKKQALGVLPYTAVKINWASLVEYRP